MHFETISYGRSDLIRATLEKLYSANRTEAPTPEPVVIDRVFGSLNVTDSALSMERDVRYSANHIAHLVDAWMERQSGSLRSSIASATAVAATESLRNVQDTEMIETSSESLADAASAEETLEAELNSPALEEEIIEASEGDEALTEPVDAIEEEVSVGEEAPESNAVISDDLEGLPPAGLPL
ncbi:hypothetical protein HLB35_14695 [Halomonas sp. TBZ9]|uniref:Uncharacterized protein n=1 Tax=Vreelandella azerica TaxID=2732867 RepID=A0A7Y3TYT1_9GAMM|nr:hypothetical protein [Halomonas azerica]NOG32693.1 hypothetical protein [Halomonas azerica]